MRRGRILAFGLGLLATLAARATAQNVAGIVMESRTGRPIEGARVAVQGTPTEMRTDGRGRFTFTGLSGSQVTLAVSFVGFRPLTQVARVGDTDVRLQMTELAVNLGELVVTGTPQAVEKRTLGNSTATVHAADQQQFAPSPDVSNLINSRAPGVVVIPGTGQVGSGPRIRIRGANSFSLTDQPLIYIDGARVDNDVSTGISVQGFSSGISSRLNDIDPDNIESIEILKGPAASTLYGTEATNGVIQIITKKGKAGQKATIGLTSRQGTNWFMNPEGRIRQPINRVCPTPAPADPSTCPLVSFDPVGQEMARYKSGLSDRPLFTNGYAMGYGASLSGGSQNIRYHVGSTFDADNGIEPTNNQRRLTTNVNLTVLGGDKYDVSTSFGYVKNKTNQAFESGAGGIWFSTIFGDPAQINLPTRGFIFGPPEFQWGSRQAVLDVNRFTGSVTINHRPTSWLSQKLTVGLDQTDEAAEALSIFLPPEWIQFNPGDAALGSKFKQRRTINYTTFDYSATARKSITKNITTNTSVGAQYYRRRTDLIVASGSKFAGPGLATVLSTAITTAQEDFVENSTLGVFAQETFGWKDKFYLTGAVRVDNNSAFGDNFDLIAYPKVSAAWIVSENPDSKLNTLKVRAAYGQAGQQPVAFAALRSYRAVTGGDGGAAPIPEFLGNPDLRPERSAEWEVGADAGLLNDRLGFSVTAYTKKTRDAILQQTPAPSLGFSGLQFINVGAIQGKGVEFEVYGRPIESKQFNLDLRFSISHNTNKVTDLGLNPDGTQKLTLGVGQATVGQAVDAARQRKVISATFDPATKRAINVLCDDGIGGPGVACGAAPPVVVGRYDPPTEGAFSATATIWGRLRAYGLVDFKHGNVHLDNNRRALCQVFLRCDENFNPQNYDPKLIAEIQTAGVATSFAAHDASFVKLREVSLAYTMPRNVARFLRASDGTIALTARNLHTWTDWTGLDPEAFFVLQQFVRQEQDNTPQLASFNVSINLTF